VRKPLRTSLWSIVPVGALALSALPASAAPGERESFNSGWVFAREEQPGADGQKFDDGNWSKVTLPHDWAIAGPFDPKYNARTGGLPVHGTGWYRKRFVLPKNAAGKVVTIEFDGAMAYSTVWVNGQEVGSRPNGYIGFEYDITRFLKPGEENVVAVRLAPMDLSTRWYTGAGLYRDVWLEIDDPVHFDARETVVTMPSVSAERATLKVDAALDLPAGARAGDTRLAFSLVDAGGKVVASATRPVPAGTGALGQIAQTFSVNRPHLWNLDDPYLYELRMTVTRGGKSIDTMTLPVGFRSVVFTPNDGMLINGKRVPIQGVNLHHDNGALGAVANRRAIERKLEIMKSMGVNAIRTSHNPPSPILIDLANRMGFIVDVEAFDVWALPKKGAEQGYNLLFPEWHERDLVDMVKDFRNDPSVVMWSIGNEIMEQAKTDGWKVARELSAIVRKADPTRPTTAGFNNYTGSESNKLTHEVDVVGMNYKPDKYAEVKKRNPQWIIMGSETGAAGATRGVYDLTLEKYDKHPSRRVTEYDIIGPVWTYPPDYEWEKLAQTPSILGEFIWTGIDYLGEPSPYGGRDNLDGAYWNADWPARSSTFGPVDLAGLPKDRYYLYQSQWTSAPMVHLLPHWNWEGREGQKVPVMAYTNGDSAELFLNGRSLGRKIKGKDKTPLPMIERYAPGGTWWSPYRLSWQVPYEPGTLKVVAYKDGKQIGEDTVVTSGSPAKIALSADRKVIKADGRDLSYITVDILDRDGNFVPYAESLVTFLVSGGGEIAGVDNGDAASVEPFQANYRRAFNGKAVVIVRANKPGPITIRAVSDRLLETQTTIEAR